MVANAGSNSGQRRATGRGPGRSVAAVVVTDVSSYLDELGHAAAVQLIELMDPTTRCCVATTRCTVANKSMRMSYRPCRRLLSFVWPRRCLGMMGGVR